MGKKHLSFLIANAVVGSLLIAVSSAYASVPTVSSAKITGANTVTIVYSERVATNLADYTSFSGALGGRNLTGLSGSGGNAIMLTFDGSVFGPDANGGLAIASSTTSVSDHSTFNSGTIFVSDGQIPLLTSMTVSSSGSGLPLAKAGGSIMLNFSVNEAILSPAVTVLGHTVAAIGGSTGPYTVNYVMSSGDQEGMVSVTIRMADSAGNVGNATLSLANSNGTSAVVASPVVAPAPVPAAIPVLAPAITANEEKQYQALIEELKQKKAQLEQGIATLPVSASVKFIRALGIGSIGDDVRELQKRLTSEGLYAGAITGKFGAQTRKAVKEYQKKHRLTQLGTVGPSTRALLNR